MLVLGQPLAQLGELAARGRVFRQRSRHRFQLSAQLIHHRQRIAQLLAQVGNGIHASLAEREQASIRIERSSSAACLRLLSRRLAALNGKKAGALSSLAADELRLRRESSRRCVRLCVAHLAHALRRVLHHLEHDLETVGKRNVSP